MFTIKSTINVSIGNKTITDIISEWFNQLKLADKISNKYNIDEKELEEYIQSCLNNSSPNISLDFQLGNSKEKKSLSDDVRCKYMIKENRRCMKKISKESNKFCSCHIKHDTEEKDSATNVESVHNPVAPTKKYKKRNLHLDKTGTLVDKEQGIVYYKDGDNFWAIGKKKNSDSFKIFPLGISEREKLKTRFSQFEHNDVPPIYDVAEFNEEDTNWINMINESQRNEKTLETDAWNEWIQTEYLRMREKCLTGMKQKQFYEMFEIKYPDLPPDFELGSIDYNLVEELHNANLMKDEDFEIARPATDQISVLQNPETIKFIECIIGENSSNVAKHYKYRSELAYIFYEFLTEKERQDYIACLREKKPNNEKDFMIILYGCLQT